MAPGSIRLNLGHPPNVLDDPRLRPRVVLQFPAALGTALEADFARSGKASVHSRTDAKAQVRPD